MSGFWDPLKLLKSCMYCMRPLWGAVAIHGILTIGKEIPIFPKESHLGTEKGSFCLKGGSTGPWWPRWGWGVPSLFCGPGVFLSETLTWGERRRLGKRVRKDFLSNGPGQLDSSLES